MGQIKNIKLHIVTDIKNIKYMKLDIITELKVMIQLFENVWREGIRVDQGDQKKP